MNLSNLEKAIHEAERFLEHARHLRGLHKGSYVFKEDMTNRIYEHPKYQGLTRRASLDLTRALADLRKPF